MQPLPHHYLVTASAAPDGDISVGAKGLPVLSTSAPPEFDGAPGRWSPETLLIAAVVDCFAITFRGVARSSNLPWTSLACEATGTLDRPDGVTRFTEVHLSATLALPPAASEELARRLLEKAERTCLISRSLNAAVHLAVTIAR